jgi:hypothetical protein
MSVVTGDKKVLIAGVKFTNEKEHTYSLQQLRMCGSGMVKFFNKNSRNLLQMHLEMKLVDVPFVGNKTSVTNQAGPYVKNKFPGKDIYIIVSKFLDGDHAGGGFAYCQNTLTRTVVHEVGHCLGLAHAGAYVYKGKGYDYDQYGDGLSPMSRYPANCLTSPAYCYLGWIPDSEIVTISNLNQLPSTFKLKRINNFGAPGISVIRFKSDLLKNKDGRDAFLSFPQQTKFFKNKPFAALHLLNKQKQGFGGGSAKIKTFAKAFYDSIFTGLDMVIESGTTTTELVITVSQKSPTVSHEIEVVPLKDSDMDGNGDDDTDVADGGCDCDCDCTN